MFLTALLLAALAGFTTTGLASGSSSATEYEYGPTIRSAPRILGRAQVGQTLRLDTGAWTTPTPLTAVRQRWLRCNRNGNRCARIPGANGRSYRVATHDLRHRLRARVIAVNRYGKGTAFSAATDVVTRGASVPTIRSAPRILGRAQVGQTLRLDTGAWTTPTPLTAVRQKWLRCDRNGNRCAPIPGANGRSYPVATDDLDHRLQARVTAVNRYGKGTALSAPTDVVTRAGSGGGNPNCTNASSVSVSSIAPPIRLLIDRWEFDPTVVNRATRTITARVHVSDTCNQSVAGAQVWGTAIPYNQLSSEQSTTGPDGYTTLTFRVETGFPANPGRQQIMAMLFRAVDPHGSTLAGTSTRRVVRLPVNSS